jgi:hypothetical protein
MDAKCRHIKVAGDKCKAPALKGKDYCYFHSAQRRRDARPLANRWVFDIPFLEDHSTIQLVISEVADSLAGNRIDTKRAGLLLYALQIASQNLNHGGMVSIFPVRETTTSSDGQEIAPVVENINFLDDSSDDDDIEDDEEDEDNYPENSEAALLLGIPGYKPL